MHNPNIIVESQLGIIVPNMQGLCFALPTLSCWFSTNFIQFVQFHNEYKILILVKDYFWALWEGKIPFELGHIRVMETNVTNSLFGLSSYLFKTWTRSSHSIWKTRLQILCIVFESQFGIIILKIPNLCFAHQTTHLRFFSQLYASLPMRQWVEFPYLGRVTF